MNKFINGLLSISLISSVYAAVERKRIEPVSTSGVEEIRAMNHAEAARIAQQQEAELRRLESEIQERERHLNRLTQEIHDLKVKHVSKLAQHESALKYAERRDLDDVSIEPEVIQQASAPRPSYRATAHRNPVPNPKNRMYHPMR